MINISKSNFFLLTICALEYVWVHHLLFPKVDMLAAGSGIIIFLQAFLIIGLVSWVSKTGFILCHFFGNVILILLEIYHRVYTNPITLTNIMRQYREGADYLSKSTDYLFSEPILLTITYFLLTTFLIIKFYDSQRKNKLLSMISLCVLLIIGSFMTYQYRYQKFRIKDFRQITEFVGYGQGWLYETISSLDEAREVNYVIKMANEPAQNLPPELQSLKHHNHIYVIQLESFQYAAFEKEEQGRKVMPYLQSLQDKAAVYKILPTQPHPSANSDFAAMHGVYDVADFYYVIYQAINPNKLYQQIMPLPWLYRNHGYHTDFYHGYYGHFYGRRSYMEAMKFDEVYFAEDLKNKYSVNPDEWGISDEDIVDFIIKNQQDRKNKKSFSFFITVSTHDPYEIGKRICRIYAHPQNLSEQYFNAFNFVDEALNRLMEAAPVDSLFVLYSDHPSLQDLPMNTFFMVYSKKQNLKGNGEISFPEMMQIIKSLLYQNISSETDKKA